MSIKKVNYQGPNTDIIGVALLDPVTGAAVSAGGSGGAVTVADGADVALGALVDASVAAGSTGSISAKLRLMTSQLSAIQAAVEILDNAIAGSEMQVDIVSGTASGTEYTEGATDATITGKAVLWEDSADTLRAVSATKPLPVNVVAGSPSGYTEGDTDATITGTAAMWEDTSDVLRAVSAAKPMPVNVVAGSASGTEYTEGATDASITGTAILWEDGSDTLRAVSASKPLPIEVVAGYFVIQGGTDPLTVGGDSAIITPGVTISTSPAYSAGDVVGGVITLTNAVGTLQSGIFQQIVIGLDGTVAALPQLSLYLFDALPSQTTADNVAFNWASGDGAKFLSEFTVDNDTTFDVAAGSICKWKTTVGATVRHWATIPVNQIVQASGVGNFHLYLIIATRSAFTAISTTMRVRAGLTRS